MTQPNRNLAHIPRELRQSNLGYGLGVTKLFKLASPAAGASFTRAIPPEYWERLLSLAFNLQTSAAAGTRTLAVVFQDQDGNTFNLVPISNEIGPSQNINAYADLASVTQVQVPASHQNESQATAPAAGATIATLTLPSGGWTINWSVMQTAGSTAADLNNMALNQGATQLLVAEMGTVLGTEYTQTAVEIQVPIGGATITVKTIGAASASAVYTAQLTAIPANLPAAQVQIPDFLMHSGWAWGIQVGNAQAADQLSGILILAERFPSDTAGGYQPADGGMFYPGPRPS